MLKLLKEKKLHNIVIIKKYQYDMFDLKVSIDPSGFVDIKAENKKHGICIHATNNNEAILTIEYTCIKSKEEIDELTKVLYIAYNLVELINEQREELIASEYHFDN